MKDLIESLITVITVFREVLGFYLAQTLVWGLGERKGGPETIISSFFSKTRVMLYIGCFVTFSAVFNVLETISAYFICRMHSRPFIWVALRSSLPSFDLISSSQ